MSSTWHLLSKGQLLATDAGVNVSRAHPTSWIPFPFRACNPQVTRVPIPSLANKVKEKGHMSFLSALSGHGSLEAQVEMVASQSKLISVMTIVVNA